MLALPAIAMALASVTACGSNSGTSDGSNGYEPGGSTDYLVGFKAGGGTDLTARQVTKLLSDEGIVDTQFSVQNLTGSGGLQAYTTLAKRGGDDALMQLVDIPSGLYVDDSNVSWKEFDVLGQVANNALLVVVPKDSPYETAKDLFAAMDQENVAIGLPSTTDSREAGKWYEMAEGFGVENADINFVPSAGISAVVPEIISGRNQAALFVPTVAQDLIKSGKVKALAVTSEKRLDEFSDVPTLQEQGSDVTFYRPQGVAIAASASAEAKEYWIDAIKDLTETDAWKTFTSENGYINEYKTPGEYDEWLDTEIQAYENYLATLD